jgi:Putative  PD-(D/E)XK family member, (DUF4420)
VSRIAPDIWAQLEASRPAGENLTARFAVPDVTDRLQCALDADGRRHLLIALAPDDEPLRDEQSRGLRVLTRELSVQGALPTRRLDIQCEDAAGHAGFDLIGGELAAQLAAAVQPPADIVRRVLAKWRRFWGQLPRTLLSREEQLGLFAELWFLHFWLLPRAGTADSVTRWRGPLGARHDFEWLGRSVEVKATASTRGPIHRINGIDQLSIPEKGDLLFFSLRVRDEAGATNTLPNLITMCRAAFAADSDALTRFEAALALAGHSPAHDEEYAKLRLRVANEELFTVQDTFPRLTTATFENGLPAGVERVEYEINLSGFEHLRLARSPEQATTL